MTKLNMTSSAIGFYYDLQNYSRCTTISFLDLETLKQNNHQAYEELARDCFGASLSGEPFSAIHGDHVIEVIINMEVKVQGGPHQGGYSTYDADNFVTNLHSVACLRKSLEERTVILMKPVHCGETLAAAT